MRKKGFLFLFIALFVAIGCANGAGRSILSQSRNGTNSPNRARSTISIRTPEKNISQRNTNGRAATNQVLNTRFKSKQNVSSRAVLLTSPKKQVVGRVATTSVTTSQGFSIDYDKCHDAYFTCMDQFCANVDETYRRCVCSSRLTEIKQKQSALSQSADALTNFHDLNLDIINKSAQEVKAMASATIGEQAVSSANDTSDSSQKLTAISDVLAKTKSKSLSNAGTLDAGGNIKSIWMTTDLASGANIANLTGEPLYNAVNAQCSEMVTEQCPTSILNMVISAYGMYIENDCATLATDLSKKKNSANAAIRETGHEMATARLENYDAHNSLPINDCIKSIRQDLTASTACGTDFVHCWDVTGLYLNIDTGEPIYSKNFYNLANQISLSGNILDNQTNHTIVNALNNKKVYAQNSLDKCRDLSGDIWDEFMRQTIIEIHQKQQEKVRTVKTECLGVINQCYDDKTNQLRDFSNITDKTLLGVQLETVEDLCQEKLDTCSNLYGGGPDGLAELVQVMHDIVDQKIIAECQDLLMEFGQNLCAVQSTDTVHSYPYSCRIYTPGDQQYAAIPKCNTITTNTDSDCGTDYANSLYQRFVQYAMQVCIRPSEYENLSGTSNNVQTLTVPTLVLQDINIVMDKMRISMGQELSKECERMGGTWITNPYNDFSIALQEVFYTETGTDKKWGYCKSTETETYTITFNPDNNNDSFTVSVAYGSLLPTITTPTKNGYTFDGYYNGSTQYYDGNAKPQVSKYNLKQDIILKAVWTTNQPTNNTNSSQ